MDPSEFQLPNIECMTRHSRSLSLHTSRRLLLSRYIRPCKITLVNMASESGPTHIAEELLNRAHPPDTASTIFREKVKQRPLLLRPSSPDPNRDARSKRQYERHQKQKAQRKSKKPKPLSAKQKRKLCLYDIPKSQQKYEIYEPLHQLWCEYMREILGLKGKDDEKGRTWVDAAVVGPVLVSADYHGAEIEVVRSKCESLVGLKGIVVKDGKFAFEIVTKRNVLKCLPKRGSVFRFEVPFEEKENSEQREGSDSQPLRRPFVFDIYGKQFEARASDRANRKFRWHYNPEL